MGVHPEDTRAPAADRSDPLRGVHKGLGKGHLNTQGGSLGDRDRLAGRHFRSEVSCICQGLDGQILAFLERPLDETRWP